MNRLRNVFAALVAVLAVSMTASAQTDFGQLVDKLALAADVTDLSAADDIAFDEPRMAYVNLEGITTIPSTKYSVRKGFMEVYDGQDHYFRKPVTISGQGGWTLRCPKRNFSLHFTDANYDEDQGANITIGEWVTQDAFHFKAFYNDYLRGIGEVCYKLFSDVVADRTPYWERGGYMKASRARCFPDGFPCAVYLNGQFYGIYAWQLKKHRKNMNQKKAEPTHIHLDGNLSDAYIFRGNISWRSFEVRNPKGLYTITGEVYDNNAPRELIDEQCQTYNLADDTDEVKAAKRLTATVKHSIVSMSRYWSELYDFEKGGISADLLRQAVADRYDTEGLIDYYVFFYFTRNGDGSIKNWQWFTYDGQRWTVTPYDLDQTFGYNLYGAIRPASFPLVDLTSGPFYWIHSYYQDDICERYAQLRDAKVFDADHINAIIDDWYERVGTDFYDQEMARWPDSPCYCDNICNEGWEWCDDWDIYPTSTDWNSGKLYHEGDVVILEGKLWRATADVQGVKPFVRNANTDSLERFHEWVSGRIDFLDAWFAYTPQHDVHTNIGSVGSPARRLTDMYTLDGRRVEKVTTGHTYIFRYNDGTTRKVSVR